jgi:energy-converting hydrogenase Eha subunit C
MMFQNYVLVDVLEEIQEVPGLSRVLRRRAWRKIAHLRVRDDGFVFALASISFLFLTKLAPLLYFRILTFLILQPYFVFIFSTHNIFVL